MSPEIEVLDQLLGGDLPLNVIAGLFPDLHRCRRALAAMLEGGEVRMLNAEGRPIPPWRYRELEGIPSFWAKGTPYRLSITDVGAARVS